ncbi:hypothetical protein D3C86_2074300 [compost metagenome]
MGGFPGKIHVGLRFCGAYLAIGQMPVPELADIPRIPVQPLLLQQHQAKQCVADIVVTLHISDLLSGACERPAA